MSIESIVEKIRREMGDEVKAAFERGYVQGAGEHMIGRGNSYTDLRQKLDREVGAHRETILLLEEAHNQAMKAQDQVNKMARAFITLHDLAKEIVGPKGTVSSPPTSN